MSEDIIHKPVYEEDEIRCDGCDKLLGYNQWTDKEFVETECKECNEEFEGIFFTYCLKCRMKIS